ncbi:BQ5605_C012g06935 [Microbotryum silenes-dioicae]|uniref:tRNA-dihydrouridine(16/17) synthase [NAD(P)(+)] n=1 Tax=Microbotryum silenes-dioicae TaxID=796604 RepID=A0A2X0LSC8_9BASI|nr:BQ5605_C012g06935 [Microbotryum silenes-dioicae]
MVCTAAELPTPPATSHDKLSGHEWWQSIHQPKYVVAPMVDQSELAWRILSRLHGANLAYTPMFHAALFSSNPKYEQEQFDSSPESIEGVAPYDRPLIVQFCANDKDKWLAAAKKVVGRCDAVDLNLGCPQGIAKKGHYGAFLMEEWDLIKSMISHLHEHLAIPVIAKLRVFPTLDKTLDYASLVYLSGAQLVTVHGRTREAKGRLAGFASWPKIRSVVDLLSPRVPVLANGGVPSAEEVEPCLAETGAKGIMSAEGNLYNPMIFSPVNAKAGRDYFAQLPQEMRLAISRCDEQFEAGVEWDRDMAAYAPSTWLAAQYLAIVSTIPHTKTSISAIKAHLFKLFRPVWAVERHLDMRELLGRAGGRRSLDYQAKLTEYQEIVNEFVRRFKVSPSCCGPTSQILLILTHTLLFQADLVEGHLPPNSFRPLTHAEVQATYGGVVPYSHAQPYLRVTKPEEDQVVAGTATSAENENKLVIQVETNGKRAASPSSLDETTEAKRSKRTDESTLDAFVIPPVIKDKTTPCINPTKDSSPCINIAANKCSHSACSACCASIRKEELSRGGCTHHEEKERKDAEKRQLKKDRVKDRKAKRAGAKGDTAFSQ